MDVYTQDTIDGKHKMILLHLNIAESRLLQESVSLATSMNKRKKSLAKLEQEMDEKLPCF